MARAGLSTRSDQALLPAGSEEDRRWVRLLHGEAAAEDWRLVEIYSLSQRPFEVELGWSAGGGPAVTAKLTASRSVRVCLVARSLQLRAANLASEENLVGCHVAQPGGFVQTENVYEVRALARTANQGGTDLEIPPFARAVKVEVADASALAGLLISLYDGKDTLRGQHRGDAQSGEGLLLGGAHRVHLLADPAGVACRALYRLAL